MEAPIEGAFVIPIGAAIEPVWCLWTGCAGCRPEGIHVLAREFSTPALAVRLDVLRSTECDEQTHGPGVAERESVFPLGGCPLAAMVRQRRRLRCDEQPQDPGDEAASGILVVGWPLWSG